MSFKITGTETTSGADDISGSSPVTSGGGEEGPSISLQEVASAPAALSAPGGGARGAQGTTDTTGATRYC